MVNVDRNKSGKYKNGDFTFILNYDKTTTEFRLLKYGVTFLENSLMCELYPNEGGCLSVSEANNLISHYGFEIVQTDEYFIFSKDKKINISQVDEYDEIRTYNNGNYELLRISGEEVGYKYKGNDKILHHIEISFGRSKLLTFIIENTLKSLESARIILKEYGFVLN